MALNAYVHTPFGTIEVIGVDPTKTGFAIGLAAEATLHAIKHATASGSFGSGAQDDANVDAQTRVSQSTIAELHAAKGDLLAYVNVAAFPITFAKQPLVIHRLPPASASEQPPRA